MSINFKNVSYIYDDGVSQFQSLKEITTTIPKHQLVAIVGETGSGKTTLMQHLNALLKPTSGEVEVDQYKISSNSKHKTLKPLRKHVGLVFQFSEYQLFEETIAKDISFGPTNFNVRAEEIEALVLKSIQAVGLDESYLDKSPFNLSGGQKRRVAIAGILAMDPDIIILDEPTAGLDPQGTIEMMELFKSIQVNQNKTIIVVTHDHDLVYSYFDTVIMLNKGRLEYNGNSKHFFELNPQLEQPKILKLKRLLKAKGRTISDDATTIQSILMEIKHEHIR